MGSIIWKPVIQKVPNNIETTVYTKPYSGNSLLRADSCHPKHFNGGIPKGQFIRLRRNCSTEEKFVEESCKLWDKFLQKGYDMRVLQKAFEVALSCTRDDLISRKVKEGKKREGNTRDNIGTRTSDVTRNLERKQEQKLILSTKYSAQFNRIKQIVNRHLPVLYGDSIFKQLLEPGVHVVARRAPTLRMSLSPSVAREERKTDTWLHSTGMFKCGSNRCVHRTHRHNMGTTSRYNLARLLRMQRFGAWPLSKAYRIFFVQHFRVARLQTPYPITFSLQ
ncbi:hypothetical protein XELAEV_18031435mg [Xenopus laevis]|uniref:Helix-turn-helix domain-containing protein n=1 Tax=Xenopus laevis TaxID=8355 RepID=A0A974HG10_XENLA|nr:hypothetical protein XELAEV_18031435mg [Xenopus laevis]